MIGAVNRTLLITSRSTYASSVQLKNGVRRISPFVEFRDEHWSDDEFRRFQTTLMRSPKAGDAIRGGSGLRKIRWLAHGRGKRGGARVIYYFRDAKNQIYLIYGYVKSEREDLSPDQVRTLAKLMANMKDNENG